MKQQYKYVYFVAYLVCLAIFIVIGSISVLKYLEKNTLMIRLEEFLEPDLNLINWDLYFSRSKSLWLWVTTRGLYFNALWLSDKCSSPWLCAPIQTLHQLPCIFQMTNLLPECLLLHSKPNTYWDPLPHDFYLLLLDQCSKIL